MNVATGPAEPVHYVSPFELKRELGNSFTAGLYRLAVMSQPPDHATDLGQDLPTGALRRVRCGGPEKQEGSTELSDCTVSWRTVGGRAQDTRYLVRLLPSGCFAAGARPRFPDHIDPTIEGYSEHPLNALVSARENCS